MSAVTDAGREIGVSLSSPKSSGRRRFHRERNERVVQAWEPAPPAPAPRGERSAERDGGRGGAGERQCEKEPDLARHAEGDRRWV